MNLPNKITIARIIAVPLFLVTLLGGILPPPVGRYIALGLFVLASASDWLDGYLARKLGLVSAFGKFMDPIADKLLVSSALIAFVELGDMAAWMVIVFISRDIIISGMRLVAVEKGIVIAASTWAKLKTAIQMLMIIMILLCGDAPKSDYQVLYAICELLKWLAVALTLVSAYDYIYKNREIFK